MYSLTVSYNQHDRLYPSPNPNKQQMLQGARPGSSGMVRPSQSQPILRGYGEGTRPGTAGSSVPGRKWQESFVPTYITKEKQVLRFFAYFQEPVHEGGSMDATGFRVRKFSIM